MTLVDARTHEVLRLVQHQHPTLTGADLLVVERIIASAIGCGVSAHRAREAAARYIANCIVQAELTKHKPRIDWRAEIIAALVMGTAGACIGVIIGLWLRGA